MEIVDFKDHLEKEYTLIQGNGEALTLKLIELEELPKMEHSGIRTDPFSLLFQGPPSPILPPMRFALITPNASRIELFLQAVVGSGPKAVYYESVFN